MKRLLLICFIGVAACQTAVKETKDFIPGTYTRFSESEFSKAWDTLRISAYEKDQGTFVVQQHTGFQRIVNEKVQPKEYKSTKVVTVFDENTKQLQDMKTGKLYTFAPAQGTVLAGSAEYKKLP